nr:FeoB-associated Cys-rich membrane protein [uncultured Mucilaginibacter sp.]
MSIQAIIIVILFIAAVLYVGRIVYNSIFSKKSCGGNCKCGVDFSAVEPQKQAK